MHLPSFCKTCQLPLREPTQPLGATPDPGLQPTRADTQLACYLPCARPWRDSPGPSPHMAPAAGPQAPCLAQAWPARRVGGLAAQGTRAAPSTLRLVHQEHLGLRLERPCSCFFRSGHTCPAPPTEERRPTLPAHPGPRTQRPPWLLHPGEAADRAGGLQPSP